MNWINVIFVMVILCYHNDPLLRVLNKTIQYERRAKIQHFEEQDTGDDV
jgi:hypothetical protein